MSQDLDFLYLASSVKPTSMQAGKYSLLSLVLTVALNLCGLGATAQGLPEYGIVRLEGDPIFTEGSYSRFIAVLDSALVIQSVGWNTETLEQGWAFQYFAELKNNTLIADTTAVRNFSHPPRRGGMVVPGGVFAIRTMVYDSYDTNYVIGPVANVTGYISFSENDSARIQTIDSIGLGIELANTVRTASVIGIRELGGLSSDTVRVLSSIDFIDSTIQANVSIRSFVPDDSIGYRLVKTLTLAEGIYGEDITQSAWSAGDTLGRIELQRVQPNSSRIVVRYWNRHTGEHLGIHPLRENHFPVRAIPSVSEKTPYGFVFGPNVRDLGNDQLSLDVDVEAVDLRTAQQVWSNSYTAKEGWHVADYVPIARVDSTGDVLLVAWSEAVNRSAEFPDRYKEIVVHGADASTGDSLWRTRLRLDSFATERHDILPMDIAFKAQRAGYVVACWVADFILDPNRPELRYSYTSLFFLDSLGCLAPGCRDSSSTTQAGYDYEVVLMPNPVPRGQVLQIQLPDLFDQVRYVITDAQGREVGFGESLLSGERIAVEIGDLLPGAYYITVWPSARGGALLTKAFVVQ